MDAFVLAAFVIDCIRLLIKFLRCFFFSSLWLFLEAFLKHFALFTSCSSHISSSTKSKKTQEMVLKTESTSCAVFAAKYKPENSPRGVEPQLQINWNLVYCLWAILQLDQCIMSWHGPSLCADSSVTLRDLVKFISAVSPSQLAGFPLSPFTVPEMVSVPSGHKGNRIHLSVLLQVSDTLQRNMWLRYIFQHIQLLTWRTESQDMGLW